MTLLPVSEIVESLTNAPEPEINTTAMTIIRDLYMNIFHKKAKAKEKTKPPPEEIRIEATERAYRDL